MNRCDAVRDGQDEAIDRTRLAKIQEKEHPGGAKAKPGATGDDEGSRLDWPPMPMEALVAQAA
jgi:hypothetical protein